MRGLTALLAENCPEFESNCYVWFSYSCWYLREELTKGNTHKLNLKDIIQRCDLLFTPVFDPQYYMKPRAWPSLPTSDWFAPGVHPCEAFSSGGPRAYMSRSWCRVEMFLAATQPLVQDLARIARFQRGLRLT